MRKLIRWECPFCLSTLELKKDLYRCKDGHQFQRRKTDAEKHPDEAESQSENVILECVKSPYEGIGEGERWLLQGEPEASSRGTY